MIVDVGCQIAYLDITGASVEAWLRGYAVPADVAAAARHRRASRQRQSLAVRGLCRAMLEEGGVPAASWHFEQAFPGGPVLARAGDRSRSVCFAHSAAMVACAVSKLGPIGIDIEQIRHGRPIQAIAQTAFGPAEANAVARHGARGFYRIWTQREALAKATGRGFALLVEPHDLVISETGAPNSLPLEGREWQIGAWEIEDGYAIGFARVNPSQPTPVPLPRRFRVG